MFVYLLDTVDNFFKDNRSHEIETNGHITLKVNKTRISEAGPRHWYFVNFPEDSNTQPSDCQPE